MNNKQQTINNKQSFIKRLLILSIIVFLAPNFALAETYYYQDYSVGISINKDSTFDVTEKQNLFLDGNFGYFYRDINKKRLDHFSDIRVFDSNGDLAPEGQLDISWKGDEKRIQWNFLRRDFYKELKNWQLEYKVYGGLDFYEDHDEIYWNAIPKDREAPIKNLKVIVRLPEAVEEKDVLFSIYTEDSSLKSRTEHFFQNNQTMIFTTSDVPANTNFTIAVGWPKELIQKPLFYKEQLINWIFLGISILTLIATLVYMFLKWRKHGKEHKIDKSIMVLYEPPENLKPAVAEILLHQDVKKGMGATIVDLARRGYLQIAEKQQNLFGKIKLSEYYTVKKLKLNYEDLLPFEKKVIEFLFESSETEISTLDISKRDPYKAQVQFKAIKKSIFRQVAKKGYSVGNIQKVRTKSMAFPALLFVIGFFVFFVFMFLGGDWIFRGIVILISFIVSGIFGIAFGYNMPALTKQGAEQRYKWLCFKEYLQTAEKYRLAFEVPETFSRFLPYAIIFGVEKQWIKKFAPLFTEKGWNQNWYVPYMSAGYSATGPSFFNAASFTNSFSAFTSSFTRSFSAGAGGGASGGGGSAGGGGGGGGGGAG